MKITVIGTGYVGLVSGVCLAKAGHEVLCLDINPKTVDMLNQGKPHIFEHGLEDMLKEVIAAGRFRSEIVSEKTMDQNDVFMIAVGTPSTDGKINLAQVESAATEIGKTIKIKKSRVTVIVKSTCVPGTTDTFVKSVLKRVSKKDESEFGLGMNPEFLREGNAVDDFMKPDRIVLGHEDSQTREVLSQIYSPWSVEKVYCNTRTAEMIKYANNYFLALQISAANEVANLCFKVGNIDPLEVIKGVIADKRWSPIGPEQKRTVPEITTYLIPGCGFGGSCFPKDVEALRTMQKELGLEPRMAQATLDVNYEQSYQVIHGLKHRMGSLKGKKVLVLGLAFKPDTDDIRESPGIKIAKSLISEGAEVKCHDPIAIENVINTEKTLKPSIVETWETEVPDSDIIVVATKWDHYRSLSNAQMQTKLSGKTIFDCRRLFDVNAFPKATYLSIGHNFSQQKEGLL